MDGRMDEQKPPCVLQDFVPFGAAAQKKVSGIISQSVTESVIQ